MRARLIWPLLFLLLLSVRPLIAKTVTLAQADNHTAVSLNLGDTLIVTLPDMKSDAYRWKASLPAGAPLTAQGDERTPPPDPKGEGTHTFRFNAARVGSLTLRLAWTRQQKGPAPEISSTYAVRVTVASGATVPGFSPPVLIGSYRGVLPCADCGGLRTEIRLYAKGRFDMTDAFYIRINTYLATRNGDVTYTGRGTWLVLKGDAVHPDATVYGFDPGYGEQTQYMVLGKGGATLTQLDSSLHPIDTKMNLTLSRIEPSRRQP